MITYLLAKFFSWLELASIKQKEKEYRRKFKIHKNARLGYLPDIVFKGNVEIGENSYFNSGKIYSGNNSMVKIGNTCAIGYNVVITAITHDPDFPTGPENERPYIEASVTIGDNTWIGSNVFILPGVQIGNDCVVGANAVVTRSFPDNTIVGGVPARLIREKNNKCEK